VNQFLLTMTACIDPGKGHCTLVRSDPMIRLGDYQSALRYWLKYEDARTEKILFIENSGYPLHTLEDIAKRENPGGKEVEFVSLDCNWYPPGGHYGYAELRMLDLGLEQSRLRRLTTHMIKMSGRFRFPALGRLLDRLPTNFDVAADARVRKLLRRRHERPFITTQIILFSHRFYRQHLQNSYQELGQNGVTFIEWLFYDKLIPWRGTPGIFLRFPCNVDPAGFPAHRARSYDHPMQKTVYAIRGAMRQLFPSCWI
jgi:hypothetical protein